ncbi:MAG: hypothetical protein IVW53_03225 [Chloroflexi bacterium]|nr:hypothetical protein [Chloroflexota bacterium]
MPAQFSPNDEFPALYRAVLDRVAALERRGEREVAAAIRRQAIAAYSAAWDGAHRTTLVDLAARARRDLDREPADGRRFAIGRRTVLLPRDR